MGKSFLSCSLFWHYTVIASRSYYEIRRVLLWRSLFGRIQYLFFKRISLFCFFLKEIVRMISIWHESEGRLPSVFTIRARILVQVTIYRRLLIGRDGHLDQSEAYDISYDIFYRVMRNRAMPVIAKHLYNIFTRLDQRRRCWADVVWMLCKLFAFAWIIIIIILYGPDAAFISKQKSVKPNIIMLKRHFTKWYLTPLIFQGTN